jgi:hypothetical protein
MKNLRSIVSALALTCLAFVSTAQKAADYINGLDAISNQIAA